MRDAALKLQNCAQIDLEIEKIGKFKYWRLFKLCDEKLKPFELSKTQNEKIGNCMTRPEATYFFAYFLKPLYEKNKELFANEEEKIRQKRESDRIKMHDFYLKHGLLKPPSSSAGPSATSTTSRQNNVTLTSCVLL